MALVTRSEVLEQLGLTDTTEEIIALTVGIDCTSSVSAVVYQVSGGGTTLTVNITGGDDSGLTSFDLTSAAYNTVGELVTALNALDGVSVTAAVGDGEPSTPLQDGTTTLSSGISRFSGGIRYASTGTASAFSSFVDTAIAQATERARRTLHMEALEQASVTERVHGGTVLIFSSPPVTSATIKRVDADGTVLETLASTDYYLDTQGGYAKRGSGWSDSTDFAFVSGSSSRTPARNRMPADRFARANFPNWLLEYTGGYTAETIPADLHGVIRQHAIDLVLSRRDVRSLASEAVLARNKTYRNSADMLAQHVHDLSPFARPSTFL